jgi:hypothetical protein
MIELYALMWVVATFTAVIGFLRGWNREVVVTAACMLGMFLLFQFDSLIRGIVLRGLNRDQTFFIQAGVFLLIVYVAYRNRSFTSRGRSRAISAESILGAMIGFFNGYLIMGAIWYFLDINEYPLDPLIVGPAITSPSAQNLAAMPMVILSGGVGGSGDFLAIIVIILLLFVILAIS